MKKKITILVLCFFIVTIFAGGAAAKNDKVLKVNNANKAKVQQVKFTDINSDWAKDEIDKAARKGYMKGYGDATFQPNKPITCLEAIVALMSTVEQEGDITLEDVDLVFYNSLLKKIPEWGRVYIAAAIDEGILMESEMKTFNPNQGIKRYQVAVYFARMAENGYGDYIQDLIVEKETNFKIDDILNDLNKADIIMDETADMEGAEELDFYEFESMLENLRDYIKNLDEEDIEQNVIDEIIEEIEDLINELDYITYDAEEEEFDELLEELDKVMAILEGIEKDLHSFKVIRMENQFFGFKDADQIPLQARESIRVMQKLRIMLGDTDGNFSPMRVVKRNELAAMLNRLDDNYFSQRDCEFVTGILDDIEYDGDKEMFTLIIVDENGRLVDRIDFTDEDRLYYEGQSVSFEKDIDEDKYAAIEDIETDGKINVCIDNQDELVWVKIYSPDED